MGNTVSAETAVVLAELRDAKSKLLTMALINQEISVMLAAALSHHGQIYSHKLCENLLGVASELAESDHAYETAPEIAEVFAGRLQEVLGKADSSCA
ncbi:hypothetical protein [uncultured Gilvimarinus sp.]|uniref:hypothetical protein n=1 Tax=uncultured Gilvimarinus sp. TaxID=1689143 RepID=UPI0030DA415A